MELRLNQTIMNSQKVVVSQPQVSVPVATPVEPQPAPQSYVEETPVEPEISPEPEESMEPEPEISPDLEENRNRRFRRIWKKTRNRKFCRIWRRVWNRRFRWSRKKIWNRRFCRIYRKKRVFEPEEEPPVMAADEIIPPDPEESIEEAEELVEPDPIPEEAIVDEADDENLPEELPPMPDLSDQTVP